MKSFFEWITFFLVAAFLIASCAEEGLCVKVNGERNCIKIED